MRSLVLAFITGLGMGFLVPVEEASGHCADLERTGRSQAGPLCCCFPWNGTGTNHIKNNGSSSHQVCILGFNGYNSTNLVYIGSQCHFISEGSTQHFNIGTDKINCTDVHKATTEITNPSTACDGLDDSFEWGACGGDPCG